MGYALIWVKDDGTKMYCTNTHYIDSFSDDIENCSEIIQQVNAEKAAKNLVKHGLYDQMPSGKLYVATVVRMALPLTEIEPQKKLSGYIIESEFDGVLYQYRGAKKPAWCRPGLFRDNGTKPTVFKTEKEALKLIQLIINDYRNSYEDEEKEIERRKSKDSRHVIKSHNAYKRDYMISRNSKVIFKNV